MVLTISDGKCSLSLYLSLKYSEALIIRERNVFESLETFSITVE